MSNIRKHEYMHKYPFVCTQTGTRMMTKKEAKQAQAYLLDIVDNPTKVGTAMVSAISIVAGIVVGVVAYLVYLF